MEKTTVLITGANRGLGLKLTEEYAKLGWQVIATCRNPDKARELNNLTGYYASINIYRLEVEDSEQIKKLATQLHNQAIDILINNAGIYRSCTLGNLDKQAWLESFAVNAIAPYEITNAFLPHLKQGQQKKWCPLPVRWAALMTIPVEAPIFTDRVKQP